MVDPALGYYYRLTKERRGNTGPMPRARTYWHADPVCSSIPRGAFAVGPVPVVIDQADPNVFTCACFDDAGAPGIHVSPSPDAPLVTKGRRR